MSESLAVDRILPPTPQRRQRARRDGHVARSPHLTAAVNVLGTLLALKLFGPAILASWRSAAAALIDNGQLGGASTVDLTAGVATAGRHVAASLLPMVLMVMGVAVLAHLAQVGLLLAPQRLSLRLDAVSPSQNLWRIFSGRSLALAAGSLLKLAVVVFVGWLAVRAELLRLVMLQTLPIDEIVPAGGAIVMSVGLKLALALLALGLLDYALALWRHEQDLRLTPQEAREEARRTEGDPQLRARRRRVARQRPAETGKRPKHCALIVESATLRSRRSNRFEAN